MITLRRTACYGACPIYSLEIFASGKVHFNGERFVASIGSQEAHIAPSAVQALLEEFAKVNFFDLQDVYETRTNPDGSSTMITDLPTTYISLHAGGLSKTIKDYAFAPEELGKLEADIDRAANTHRWIHGADDLKIHEMVQTDLYSRTKAGLNLFMQAAGKGDHDTLMRERSQGTDINAQDETGWTALMLAAEQCREPEVRQLLAWNANVNLKDHLGDDALIGAASGFCYEPATREAQAKIIQLLIARGADPNTTDSLGLTPLMLASMYGNAAAVRALIDCGAKINSRDHSGKTPLDHATEDLQASSDAWFADELKEIVELLERRSHGLPVGPAVEQ